MKDFFAGTCLSQGVLIELPRHHPCAFQRLDFAFGKPSEIADQIQQEPLVRLSETPGFMRESIRPGLGTLPTTKRIDRAGRASDSGFDFVNRLPHIRLTIRNQFDCQRLNVGTSGHREGLSNMIFGGSNMIPARYCTVRDAAWSWSVVDANTGRVMAYSNVILGGLSERIAEDMAKLLNLEYSGSDAESASSPRSGGT